MSKKLKLLKLGKSSLLISASAAALCTFSTPVVAQDSDGDVASGDTIVVTARRREESLQEVPVSVSAFSPDELADLQILDGADLVTSVPSLQIGNGGLFGNTAAAFFVRGQGVGFGGAPPSVVPYFSEVPLDVNGGSVFALNDVESLQVLRGPQGTLFGRNASGGAVLIQPKAPGDEVEAFADFTYGNYNAINFAGGVTLPIQSDKIGIRLSGAINNRDGYTENISGSDFDDVDNVSGRIFIRLDPSENIRNDLVYNYFQSDTQGTGGILNTVRPGSAAATLYPPPSGLFPFPLPNIFGTGLADDVVAQQTLGPRTINDPFDYWGEDITMHVVTNTTSLQMGNVTFKNIFGYQDVEACISIPTAPAPTNFFIASCFDTPGNFIPEGSGFDVNPTVNHRQITEEFNISATLFDDRLDIIAGAFFLWIDPKEGLGEFTATRSSKSLFVANQTGALSEERSRAVYAQGTFAITDRLSATGGFRYTWDDRLLQFGQVTSRANGLPGTFGCAVPQLTPTTAPADCFVQFENSYDDYGYTAGLDYQVTDDLLLYGVARRGYKSGGFNPTSSSPDPEFNPEIFEDFELGFKYGFDTENVSGNLNFAYFNGDVSQYQASVAVIGSSGGAFLITTNAGGASIDGIEVEADLTFFDRFNVSGYYSHLDASYDDCPASGPDPDLCFVDVGVDVTASRLQRIPENTVSITGTYAHPLGTFGDLVTSVTYYNQSQTAYAADNVLNFEGIAPGYDLWNARVEISNINDTGVSVAGFVRNIENDDNIVSGTGLGALIGTNTVYYGEPRMYGINIRFDY